MLLRCCHGPLPWIFTQLAICRDPKRETIMENIHWDFTDNYDTWHSPNLKLSRAQKDQICALMAMSPLECVTRQLEG